MLLDNTSGTQSGAGKEEQSVQATRKLLLNPKTASYDHLDEPSRKLVRKTIEFFEQKGKAKLKDDDHERVWYSDFLEFSKKEKLFSTFLTVKEYGADNCRWDTCRNCAINEILGFYGLSYWYTWQVTILGLGPIWMSNNDDGQNPHR